MAAAVKELLEKRAQLVSNAREILDRNREGGKLSADDQAHYDRIFAEVNSLSGEVEQRSQFASRQAQLDAAAGWEKQADKRDLDPNPETPEQRAAAERAGLKLAAKTDFYGMLEKRAKSLAIRHAFENYLKRKATEDHYRAQLHEHLPVEYRDLLAGTAGSGADLIPPVEFIDQILIPRDRQVLIRKKATVRRLLKSTDGYQPTIETNPDDADWTTEIQPVNPDNTGANAAGGMTTGKRELKPNVLTKLVKVSIKELMVLPQVSELIADRLGYKFGVSEEKAFMVGTGNGQPLGVFTLGTTSGIKSSSDVQTYNAATAPTMDGLIAAKYTLPPPYWANAEWMFHPVFISLIAQIKSLINTFIWQPSTQAGQPDMLLGFPVRTDVWAPSTVAANAYAGILGDFSYYHIADLVEPFSVQRLNELYAGTNEVGFLGREYCDGMPVMSEAFVRVQLGASGAAGS